MFIQGWGTAVPQKRYSQRECWDALTRSEAFQQLALRSRAILKKVLLADNGIEFRHLVLDPLAEAFDIHPDALHGRFMTHAPKLASAAAERALARAGLLSEQVDAVVVSTCTGYACPGLTSYVAEALGLRPDVQAFDLVGQGCGAALPNLRLADALIESGRAQCVLNVCAEVCSAAFYLDDDPGVLISACLFGDGAGAVVCGNEPASGQRQVRWTSAHSLLDPADRDYLKFEQRNGMLRNILAKQVPGLAAKAAERVLAEALQQGGRTREEIRTWLLHAGGRDILLGIAERLHLPLEDLRWSSDVLRNHGNISSPSVLFALTNALDGGAEGGLWWISSFGAGFSCHGAFLEVSQPRSPQ